MKKEIRLVPLRNEFHKFIKASIYGKRRKADGTRLAKSTVATYKNLEKIVDGYSDKQPEPNLYMGYSVNRRLVRERIAYWRHFLYQFGDYLNGRGFAESYIWNNFKILRCFMNYVHEKYGTPDSLWARFKMPIVQDSEPITLSIQQFLELVDLDLKKSDFPSSFQLIRDIAITGCLTALRYSDLIGLQWSSITENENSHWLEVRSKKTGISSRMVIPEYLYSIFANYRVGRRGKIFPRISNVNLNKRLKKLGELLGWNEKVLVVSKDIRHRRQSKPFYEMLTTHTLRRTAITMMLEHNVPEQVVRRISGHAGGSKEFYRYIRVSQKWKDDQLKSFHSTLKLSEFKVS